MGEMTFEELNGLMVLLGIRVTAAVTRMLRSLAQVYVLSLATWLPRRHLQKRGLCQAVPAK